MERMHSKMLQHVYIIGAKGVSFYGGYERFVQKLLEYHKEKTDSKYHVACKANGEGKMDLSELDGASPAFKERAAYCNADLFLIQVLEWMRSAQAIVYDVKALKECCKHIKDNGVQHAVVYILACGIGPFLYSYVKKLNKLGAKIYLNPDGACEIIGTTGEKPVKSRLREVPVSYSNLTTEDSHTSISYSGGLTRLCAMPVAKLWNTHRAFLILKSPDEILAQTG